MIGMILFNVLFMGVLACLIAPQMLSRYTGGRTLPRWIFLIGVLVLGALSPYRGGDPSPVAAPASTPPCRDGGADRVCASSGAVGSPEVPAAAPAAGTSVEEAAARVH